MLPLLDYSAKKAQMLREYHAQLEPQLAQDEPWADAHARAMLSGEAQVLLREMVQLYTNLLRLDEIHHHGSRTSPQYPYEHQEQRIEDLFRQLHDLLEKGVAVAAQLERHGYPPQGAD